MSLSTNFAAAAYKKAASIFEKYASKEEEAQLTVYVDGKLVLDLSSNLGADSLMSVYSVSKALSAFALAKLVDEGKLDLDQKVVHYWPEFAANGKDHVTVRQLLSHQAGLAETIPQLTPEELLDDHAAANRLAASMPLWYPGKGHGYHGITIGPLMSELVFRITGMTIQKYYESNVRKPANADAYLGLPEELESRVVELKPGLPPTKAQLKKWAMPRNWSPSPMNHWVFGGGVDNIATTVGRQARAHGLPSAGGVASARGIAQVFKWASEGGISEHTLDRFSQYQAYGLDFVLDQPTRGYGIVFMKPGPTLPFGSMRAIGHDGAGGAMGIYDPVGKIVIGYTLRRVAYPGGVDPRLLDVIQEIRRVATGG